MAVVSSSSQYRPYQAVARMREVIHLSIYRSTDAGQSGGRTDSTPAVVGSAGGPREAWHLRIRVRVRVRLGLGLGLGLGLRVRRGRAVERGALRAAKRGARQASRQISSRVSGRSSAARYTAPG